MIHTVLTVGCPINPEFYGIALDFKEVIGQHKVMRALMRVEEVYLGVGRSMVATFFPGELYPHKILWWEDAVKKEGVGERARWRRVGSLWPRKTRGGEVRKRGEGPVGVWRRNIESSILLSSASRDISL